MNTIQEPAAPHDADARARRIAARQHGVVSRTQLLAAGVSPHVIAHRVKAGHFRPLHRGVYLLGPVSAPRTREMAAVLACGPTAVVSRRSAAALLGIGPVRPRSPVQVSVRSGHRRPSGVDARRVRRLEDDEVTAVEGVPVTTAARTIFDLAAIVGSRDLARVAAEAHALRLATPAAIRKVLDRHPGEPGTPALRSLLDAGDPALTESVLEDRFLELLGKAGLETPATNVLVEGHRVDAVWRKAGLVVELDGFRFHSSRAAFERDRSRDADLLGAGFRVLRVTWKQLVEKPEATLVDVTRALMHGSGR